MTLFDSAGCLTPEGIAVVLGSAPGQVAADAARHLANCARCQQRLLSGGVDRPLRPAVRPATPSVTRTFLLLGLVLVAVIFFFWTLRRLVG